MKKPVHVDPLDTLGAAYENMYENVADNLYKAKQASAPFIHDLIDEAKEKIQKIESVTEEDAEKLGNWLKRDLDDVIQHLSETDYELRDWLGFETSQVKSAVLHMLLAAADKTTLELLRMKENLHKPFDYHTGEVTGFGTLVCDECGEQLHFHKAGKIPPCPVCHKTSFHRIQID